jgi:VIT1/CCC1 family predicted Fe2+/Mn2+ transporter
MFRLAGGEHMEQLTPEEAALTREILEQAYQDLREEMHKTDDTDFRAGLTQRKELLAAAIRKLGGSVD